MLIHTAKGDAELALGRRMNRQRERAILLMVKANQPEALIRTLFNGDGSALLDRLLGEGLVALADTPRRAVSIEHPRPVPMPAPVAEIHGDPLTHTRSLASARMFLFDMSERLFAPRDRALADHFRAALREARTVDDMLQVGRDLLREVEAVAGPERADGISARLAKMLPAEVLTA